MEKVDTITKSKYNETEVEFIFGLIKEFQKNLQEDSIVDAISIGIITGYAAQAERVLLKLSRRKGGSTCVLGNLTIDIRTVDGFQGQERDIIILSMVRANKEQKIGFMVTIYFLVVGSKF